MVSIILNTINRSELTPPCVEWSVKCCGYPREDMEVIITDNGSYEGVIRNWGEKFADIHIQNEENKGNPQALNNALSIAKGDYISIIGNDYNMRRNWLRVAIDFIDKNPEVGIVGFGQTRHPQFQFGGMNVTEPPEGVIFAVVFHRKVFERIGYFCTFSKYGYWDGEYSRRAALAGFRNFYLSDYGFDDLGKDRHSGTEYRKLKDREAAKALPDIRRMRSRYETEGLYLDINGKLHKK